MKNHTFPQKPSSRPFFTKQHKSSLVTGTLLLTFTGMISRFIGFFYKIFLSRTIGAEALGIYQLIFPIFAFCLSIACGGIQTAISRYAASCQKQRDARLYLWLGMVLSLFLSFVCAFFIYQNAAFLSSSLLGEPRCEKLLCIMALAIPFACIHSCINGYYYGIKKAGIPSASQLVEQLVRVMGVYVICTILTAEGQQLTAAASVWGIFIGELAAALFSLTALSFQKKGYPGRETASAAGRKLFSLFRKRSMQIRQAFRNLCTMSFPLTINRIALSLAQSLENILIPSSLRLFGYSAYDALSIYGILTGMVFSTIMFPAVISNSLSVMLTPEISRAQSEHQEMQIRRLIKKTVETSLILGFLCTLLFLLGGSFIGVFLFHNHLAGIYIRTLSWICPFLFLGSTLCSILHGLGRPKTVLLLNVISSLIRILFIVLVIPRIGIRGYLWGMLASQIFSSVSAWLVLRKHCFR